MEGRKWYALESRRKDGTIRNVYGVRWAVVDSVEVFQYLHRFLLGVTDPSIWVDHKDHNGLNCLRSNLRKTTASFNSANQRKRADNKLGVKGVHKVGDKYRAELKHKNLG